MQVILNSLDTTKLFIFAYAKLVRMKVCVLYQPNSEYARQVEEFVHDFKQAESSRSIEIINLDTRDGAAMATLYDITRYPAILALDNEGKLMSLWSGPELPLMDEVAAYAHSA